MGLLGKAVLNEHPVEPAENPDIERGGLDEMGKALRDRILSLSGAEPETAISLLKAYGSFRVGVCLSLEDGMYRSYAAVGTGNPIELSPDLLRKIPDGNRYSVDYNPRDSGGNWGSVPAKTRFWAFSLDENDGDPPVRILLAGEDKNYIFPGEAVESLVQATKSAFAPSKKIEQTREAEDDFSPVEDNFPPIPVPEERFPAETKGGLLALAKRHSTDDVSDNGDAVAGDADTGDAVADVAGADDTVAGDAGADDAVAGDAGADDAVAGDAGADDNIRTAATDSGEKEIFSFLSAVLEKYGSVRGLVFENEGQADVFASRINGMVSSFADTAELGAGRCLITGGQSLDCELLSHRLSASVPGKKLLWFSAGDPGEALSVLKAYL